MALCRRGCESAIYFEESLTLGPFIRGAMLLSAMSSTRTSRERLNKQVIADHCEVEGMLEYNGTGCGTAKIWTGLFLGLTGPDRHETPLALLDSSGRESLAVLAAANNTNLFDPELASPARSLQLHSIVLNCPRPSERSRQPAQNPPI